MGSKKKISAFISEANMTAIRHFISEIGYTLPFLIDVSEKTLEKNPKIDQKAIEFMAAAIEAAIDNPKLVTSSMDITHWKVDFLLTSRLFEISKLLEELKAKVDGTLSVAGSETYKEALLFFNSLDSHDTRELPVVRKIYSNLKKSINSQVKV